MTRLKIDGLPVHFHAPCGEDIDPADPSYRFLCSMMFPMIFGIAGATLTLANYFGDGTDGAYTSVGADTIAVTLDTGVGIRHHTSFNLQAGHSLTTDNRCKALLIYVSGNATIDGTLKMDSRGASAAAAADVPISRFVDPGTSDGVAADALFPDETNQPTAGVTPGTFSKFRSQQAGGTGGGGGGETAGADGTAGTAGATDQCGGGGGGGGAADGTGDNAGKAGAAGTAFSGGAGGGGGPQADVSAAATAGATNGGAGGAGGTSSSEANRSGGGGAGNPGGASGGGNAQAGSSGTGGFLILVVGGTLTIGASGIISADGAAGGNGGSTGSRGGGAGGGSGGGRVIVLHKGALTNNGTIRANGGAGGTGGTSGGAGFDGGAGGAGTTTTQQVV